MLWLKNFLYDWMNEKSDRNDMLDAIVEAWDEQLSICETCPYLGKK
jgi:hypothetical protein